MNVSSVKNLNGETFSAVQDTALTDIVSSNSANWNEISAYQANSGNYQLTADMTAYANSASVTGTAQYGLTTAGWSEITAGGDVPAGTMNESGLEYDASGNISAYSGSAFAAQLPEEEEVEFEEIDISSISAASDYISANSANIDATVTNVSANSGAWGGSALPISAGPGIKFEMVNDTLVASTDETVLWTNSNPSQISANVTLTGTLTEPCSAFEKLRFICKGSYDTGEIFSGAVQAQDFYTNESDIENRVGVFLANRHGSTIYRDTCQISFKDSGFTANNGSRLQGLTAISENTTRGPYILQVIGINRIAGGN